MITATKFQTGDEVIMVARSTRRKLGALCFAVAGLAFIVVGVLHPHVDGPTDYNVVIATMLRAAGTLARACDNAWLTKLRSVCGSVEALKLTKSSAEPASICIAHFKLPASAAQHCERCVISGAKQVESVVANS